VVVVGGAVAEAGPVLMEPLHRAYADALRERPLRATPLLAASPLAERGTLLGAVRVALDDLVPRLLDLHGMPHGMSATMAFGGREEVGT
jgi:hypothetical protein